MHAIEAVLRKSDRSATDVRQTRATDAAHNSPGHEAGAYRGCRCISHGLLLVVAACNHPNCLSAAFYRGTDPARRVASVKGHRLAITSEWPTIQESIALRAACPKWTTALKTEPVSARCNLQLREKSTSHDLRAAEATRSSDFLDGLKSLF